MGTLYKGVMRAGMQSEAVGGIPMPYRKPKRKPENEVY